MLKQLHVNLYEGQGLGNQLWVIFSCIGLALSTDREPIIYGFENYKGKGFIFIKLRCHKGSSPSKVTIAEKKIYDLFFGLDQTVHSSIKNEIRKFSHADEILISGDLQSLSLLPSPLTKIFNYIDLRLGEDLINYEGKVAIHFRGGDYSNTICQPSKKFYLAAINYLMHFGFVETPCLVTDDPVSAQEFVPNTYIASFPTPELFDYAKASHHQGFGIRRDFAMLYYSPACVISASTFSFWAALLGKLSNQNKIVVAPLYWYANRVSNGWWSLPDSKCELFTYLDKFGKKEVLIRDFKSKRILVKSNIYPSIRKVLNYFVRISF